MRSFFTLILCLAITSGCASNDTNSAEFEKQHEYTVDFVNEELGHEVLDDGDDYSLYTNDVAAFTCAQYEVMDFLKSPSTAEFHPTDFTHIDYGDGEWMIKSHVESENGFGAMITMEFEARVVVTDEPSCKVLELYLDGEQVL